MVIPVREVEGVLELAAEIGCRVGQLPTVYLGLPLGRLIGPLPFGMGWRRK